MNENMTGIAMAQATPEITDEQLALAARNGDRRAFEMLVCRYRDTAYAYAYVRTGSRDLADDLTQEAFVRAFQSLGRFRSGASWGAWMMSILRNLCHDEYRRRRVRAHNSLDPNLPDGRALPEQEILSAELTRDLGRAVGNLPEKYRTPLLMHYSGRQTYKEIALALGLKESTVVGRMAGALRLLRRRMAEEQS